jgi:hypothetical protein
MFLNLILNIVELHDIILAKMAARGGQASWPEA